MECAGDLSCRDIKTGPHSTFIASEIDLVKLFAITQGHPRDYESPPCSEEYLADLMQDFNMLKVVQNEFRHVGNLLQKEIRRVRANQEEFALLPPPCGPVVMLNEKIYVPVQQYPNHNFVGRLIGPKGKTAKQLEAETGCKIMIRGRGSMRNKKEEDLYRGRRNYEHLFEDLHVIISARDTENRANIKLKKAVDEVKKFLHPWTEGEDELKNRQLMELAFLKNNINSLSSSMIGGQTLENYIENGGEKLLCPCNNIANCFENNVNFFTLFNHQSGVGDSSSSPDLKTFYKPAAGLGHIISHASPINSQQSLEQNNCCNDNNGVKNLIQYMCVNSSIDEAQPEQNQVQFSDELPNGTKNIIDEKKMAKRPDTMPPKNDSNRPKGPKKQKPKKQDGNNKRNMNKSNGQDSNRNNGGGSWFLDHSKAGGAK